LEFAGNHKCGRAPDPLQHRDCICTGGLSQVSTIHIQNPIVMSERPFHGSRTTRRDRHDKDPIPRADSGAASDGEAEAASTNLFVNLN
jgi:hypothetical protein